MKKLISILFVLIAFSSCGEYQKALKSEDVEFKYEVATKEYDKGKYTKAIQLFEQLSPLYRGKPQAEKMFYMYAQSLFKTEQYYSAGYQFESFVSSYPKSEKVEECAYLGALSYSKLSPVYSLDQTDTYKAIEKLDNFISEYPSSPYVSDANVILKKLRDKLEKKAFEIAKQYNTISDYKASLVVLDNFIADYPGSIYKEEALYYKLDSSYYLAINSVPQLMEQRLFSAKEAYEALIKFNSNTEFKHKADDMLARIENDLKQFSK
jgi:outer membrane protein assembly factor BamD